MAVLAKLAVNMLKVALNTINQSNVNIEHMVNQTYSQNYIKRSPLGQRKSGLIRSSIHTKFSDRTRKK